MVLHDAGETVEVDRDDEVVVDLVGCKFKE